ncbi:MAG: hypothetical protein KDA51_03570 [Planctomycetales bacterium]|nr:hypothetical protein [Planctomycetales bacterium]
MRNKSRGRFARIVLFCCIVAPTTCSLLRGQAPRSAAKQRNEEAKARWFFEAASNAAMRDDLQLSGDQAAAIQSLLEEALRESPRCDPLEPECEEQVAQFQRGLAAAAMKAKAHLNAKQAKRLHQIYWQAAGPFVLAHDLELQKAVDATESQVEQWTAIEQDFERAAMELQSRLPANPAESQSELQEILGKLESLRTQAFDNAIKVLSGEQADQLVVLMGEEFKTPGRSATAKWWVRGVE